jgi:hypothetical protein
MPFRIEAMVHGREVQAPETEASVTPPVSDR